MNQILGAESSEEEIRALQEPVLREIYIRSWVFSRQKLERSSWTIQRSRDWSCQD